ncbi:MAG: hypothetical protein NTY22_05845 [Proteobacteria bacterium]|nr:hypothetical protein [Pseudomonadota bacterium]
MKYVCLFLVLILFSSNLYSQAVIQSKEKIIQQEIDKAVNCVIAKDGVCKDEEISASLLILELSYSNDLVNENTNAIIKGKLLYHMTRDAGESAIWSGITLGMISNYVSASEKEQIYKFLKLAVTNRYFPLSGRIGGAEGLGYVRTRTLIQDISGLLKELAKDMEVSSFDGNDQNGFISLSLFKSLGNIYERTRNYEAKDLLIRYSNTGVGVYPLTQTVWANIAAGQTNMAMDGRGITETLPDLKKIATWHDVNRANDLNGIWAVPLETSRMAWSLIPKHIRDAEKLPYPETGGWENVLGWTSFSLNCLDQALRTILYVETGTTMVMSALYGTEVAAAVSPLANSIGEEIAVRYGTEFAYELGITTTSTELATAFASTTTGKIVNRLVTTAQKLGARIDKIRILIRPKNNMPTNNVPIKIDVPEELKTPKVEYETVPGKDPVINYKDATPDLVNQAKANSKLLKNGPVDKNTPPITGSDYPTNINPFSGSSYNNTDVDVMVRPVTKVQPSPVVRNLTTTEPTKTTKAIASPTKAITQTTTTSLYPVTSEWTHPDKLQQKESTSIRPNIPSLEENTSKVKTSGLNNSIPKIQNAVKVVIGNENYIEILPGIYINEKDDYLINPEKYIYENGNMISVNKNFRNVLSDIVDWRNQGNTLLNTQELETLQIMIGMNNFENFIIYLHRYITNQVKEEDREQDFLFFIEELPYIQDNIKNEIALEQIKNINHSNNFTPEKQTAIIKEIKGQINSVSPFPMLSSYDKFKTWYTKVRFNIRVSKGKRYYRTATLAHLDLIKSGEFTSEKLKDCIISPEMILYLDMPMNTDYKNKICYDLSFMSMNEAEK